MTLWSPVLAPRPIAGGEAQTIRATVTNETGHVVTLNGRTLRVLPDGVTTSKKRSYTISQAATAALMVNVRSELVVEKGVHANDYQIDPVAYLVGCLVVAGANNLELDGVELCPRSTATVAWRVDLAGDGAVHITRTDHGAGE